MSRFFVVLASLSALLVFFPAVVAADEGVEDREVAEPTSEQLRLNEQGVEELIRDNPARAVALLDEAYRLGPNNILALNLGRAYHGLGQCDQAREKLEEVFTLPAVEQPSPERVDDRAEEYLDDLDEFCEQDQETDLESPAPEDQPAVDDGDDDDDDDSETESIEHVDVDDAASQKRWGLYTMGAGALMAATSVGLHMTARSQRSDARERIESDESFDGEVNTAITQREVQQIESRTTTMNSLAMGAAAIGVVSAGIGTYLYFSASDPAETSSVDLSLDTDGVGITWSGQF